MKSPIPPPESSTPAPPDVAPPEAPAPAASPDTKSETNPVRDPLDHDGDGRKGGAARPPEVQHMVVLKADPDRGLSHGEIVAVSDADARALLKSDHARPATPTEVELAQPRIRPWRA